MTRYGVDEKAPLSPIVEPVPPPAYVPAPIIVTQQQTLIASTSQPSSSSQNVVYPSPLSATFPALPALPVMPTNHLKIHRPHQSVEGRWLIDTSLKLPKGILDPTIECEPYSPWNVPAEIVTLPFRSGDSSQSRIELG